VATAGANVSVHGGGGLRTERHHPALAALAAQHNCQSLGKVDVSERQGTHLTRPHPGSAISRTMASSRAVTELLARARFDRVAQLIIRK